VPTIAVFALLSVAPAGGFWLMAKAFDRFTAWERPGTAPPQRPSIVVLGADLHRLDAEYTKVLHSDGTGKVVRLRALAAAYDETLLACCDHYGLEIAHTSPLSGAQRLEVEAELTRHGLRW
jgi:hypothetical protein